MRNNDSIESWPSMTASEFANRDLRTLRYVEHFTVWLLRTSVTCCSNCRVAHREFNRAFGYRVGEAARVFEQVLLAMSKGIRPINIGRPGHIEITYDEQSLIAMFAASQRQEMARFRAHACWLMGHNRIEALYDQTQAFCEILRDRGHNFRDLPAESGFIEWRLHPGRARSV